MHEWQLQNARLTVFVTPDTVVASTLWQDTVGEEPENSVFQRATSTRIETGPFADGTLSVQIQPMRIDWGQEPAGLGPELGLPRVLGPFPAAAEPLLQLGRRWATSGKFPSATRLALGFVLISRTASRREGYQELSQFIDGVPGTPDATDFLYQVNRPRASRAGIEDVQVNRLSKWSVGGYRFFTVAPGTPNPVSNPMPLLYHLRLELDISTSVIFQGVILGERVEAVIDDLLAAALEVCEHGNHF
jgi:hypothetical protein